MNLLRRCLVVFFLLGLMQTGLFAQSASPITAGVAQPAEKNLSILPGSAKFDFVAYGDIRFTDPSDTRDSSPQVRQALVQRVAEVRPNFIVLTGDLVLKGADASAWKIWETETRPWRDANIQVFPTLGNHELWDDPTAVNYFAHFPELDRHRWYTLRAGNVLFFMLDSALDQPGGEEWNWLDHQLANVPGDVNFLFVVLHHPPYTHSSRLQVGSGHSARPQEQKLAEMLEQRQKSLRARLIVLSGHVHNYEHYEHGGVMYLVTGGGGATPYTIPRSPGDFYRVPGPTYHFLRFFVDGRSLRMEMVKLEQQNEQPKWHIEDSFQLRTSAAAGAVAH